MSIPRPVWPSRVKKYTKSPLPHPMSTNDTSEKRLYYVIHYKKIRSNRKHYFLWSFLLNGNRKFWFFLLDENQKFRSFLLDGNRKFQFFVLDENQTFRSFLLDGNLKSICKNFKTFLRKFPIRRKLQKNFGHSILKEKHVSY